MSIEDLEELRSQLCSQNYLSCQSYQVYKEAANGNPDYNLAGQVYHSCMMTTCKCRDACRKALLCISKPLEV